MGNFNNEHLENLWIKLVPYIAGTCTTSEITEIVKLFEHCAMAIENEADDCEHWRTMYGNACKEIDQAKESIRLLEQIMDKYRTAKTAVEKERDEYKSQLENLYKFLGKWRNAKIRDDFADPQELKELKDEIASLKESLDILKKSNETLLEDSLTYAMIQQLEARIEKLTAQLKDANNKADRCEKDLADAKKQMGYFTTSRDNWRARAKHAEDEVEDLKKNYDKLSADNKKLKARTDCLRYEVEWYRNRYRDQYDKIRELKFKLNSIYGVTGASYEQGQTDLWDKLQNVNDVKPWDIASFYPDITCMDDILSWDLEDFLDAYKSWQEKKEQERIKHMRDHLVRFCMWRRCDGCPLHTDEFICGRGKGFCDMTYEELKKHYEKVGDCDWCPFKRKDD